MERINVRSIMDKHGVIYLYTVEDAIKEIVGLIIDKAAEKVHLSSYDGKDYGQGALKYNNGSSFVVEIDKNSILQVKQLIDYE